MTYQELQEKYMATLSRIGELEKENSRLRQILQGRRTPVNEIREEKLIEKTLSRKFSLEEKVALFSGLFRGREDVFARRWHSKTSGKSGYQPVCSNDWRIGLCDKKKQKCAECPNRQFVAPAYNDYFNHLAGKDEWGQDVMGIYVITSDNRCHLLCADFDDKNCEHGYQKDVLAFVGVCKGWAIPCHIERSRSGNGAHVWVFFETPIAAQKARRLGNAILTEAMNRDGRLTFKSYDRFFPNQDAVPEGGFGNLVALPLQGRARKQGNSVFVDEQFEPYSDQWDYLANIKRINEVAIDEILKRNAGIQPLGELSITSEQRPWETPAAPQITQKDFMTDIVITKSNMLYFPLAQLSAKVLNHLKRIASFRNPEFFIRQAMRFSTFSTPRVITCADVTEEYLALPRGCEDAVSVFFREKGVNCKMVDETQHGHAICVTFNGILRANQVEAVKCLCQHHNGILAGTTAFGKTVAAIGLIAERQVNTLVLVPTKALLVQWKKQIEEFLIIDYKPDETSRRRRMDCSPVGTVSSEGNRLHGIVDVALMQSCISDGEVKPFVREYGMIIADECHHVSAVSFEQILKYANARFVYGLTATPTRKDGLQPIIFMQCGPIRYTADAKTQMQSQTFQRLLVPRFTPFRLQTEEEETFAQVAGQLANDEYRNSLIVKDVCMALKEGRSPIILTGRTAHVETLAELLKPHCTNIVTLIGSASAKEKRQKQELLSAIPAEQPLVIVATGKYVGEGFDCPRLDTLFMALPVSWKGIVAQYAGRLHREYEGKSEVLIYDYIDIHVPICEKMYRKRMKGYAAIGYRVRTADMLTTTPTVPEVIYNGVSFVAPFVSSLAEARQTVAICCPKLKSVQHHPIAARLIDLSHNGVKVTVVTREQNEGTARLLCHGIQIIVREQLSLQCAVIDSRNVWYGSINILGYHSAEDNIMFIRSAEVATSLIEAMRR